MVVVVVRTVFVIDRAMEDANDYLGISSTPSASAVTSCVEVDESREPMLLRVAALEERGQA